MNLVESSTQILQQDGGSIASMMKFITKVGYTCYKTNKEITDEIAAKFVDGLIKSGHGAMLEHGTVFLAIPAEKMKNEQVSRVVSNLISYHLWTRYTEKIMNDKMYLIIITNFRVIVDNNLQQFMKDYWYIPTQDERKCRPTVKFITDQGVLRELTRHRVFSFAVESTRYCNYSTDKFSNEITFIQPSWISNKDIENYNTDFKYFTDKDTNHINAINRFMSALINAEYFYMELIKLGWKPQQARSVLPLSTKCDVIMTGFADDWQHFFDLRALDKTGPAHPDMKKLALPLYQEFLKLDIIEEEPKQEKQTKES